MKILWFSNCILSQEQSTGSGSWLFAMRDLISRDVELVNIAEGYVTDVTCQEGNCVKEYLLPRTWKLKNGVPNVENIKKIENVIIKESPDVIHVWGIEKYWALLFSRGYIKFSKVLLEVQGVMSSCADVYYGGLTPCECRKVVSLKSVIFRRYKMQQLYNGYHGRSMLEEEIITSFNNIAVQSEWTRDQVSSIVCQPKSFFYSLRPIRKEFIQAKKWESPNNQDPVVLCLMSYYEAFKGGHFLLSAIRLLKQKYPKITLRLVGKDISNVPYYLITGYESFFLRCIKRHGLTENVVFCGPKNALQLIDEIHKVDVVVNPSLVESFSAAAAESLYLGAPTVLSYAGALVNFTEKKPVALYYSPMDYRSLAAKIDRLLTDSDLRTKLTNNAVETLTVKCDPKQVHKRQLDIYNKLMFDDNTLQ